MKMVVVWARGHLPGPASYPRPQSSSLVRGTHPLPGREGACLSHSPPEDTQDQRRSGPSPGCTEVAMLRGITVFATRQC